MAVGILCMSVVVFARQIAALVPGAAGILAPIGRITWPWYVLIGTSITLATGVLSSLTHAAPVNTQSAQTEVAA
jgi:hypothetical protein